MTPLTSTQICVVAAIGGLTVVIGITTVIALAIVLHAAVTGLINLHARRRARRTDLKTCRAIAALGTHHPGHRRKP